MAESDIIVRLRMAAEEFAQGWKRGLQEFEQGVADSNSRLDREAERSGRERGKKMGLAIAAGLTATGVAIKKALDVGLEIDATSKQLGIGVEALQGWRYAAREAGVEASSLESNVAKLTLKIGEANAGNDKAQGAFKALGVSFKMASGAGRETEATFMDMLDKLSKIEDPTKRAAMGTALLGDEYYKLEPLVRNGADGLRAATDELRQMQGVLSEDEIRNLHLTNAKLEEMKTILGVRIAGVVADNANAIMGMANALSSLTSQAIQFIRNYPQLATALAGAAAGARLGGVHGAIIGGGAGIIGGKFVGDAMDDANMDMGFRRKKLDASLRELRYQQQRQVKDTQGNGALFNVRKTDAASNTLPEATAEVRKQTELLRVATSQFRKERATAANELALPPSVDAKPKKGKSSGGSKGGGKPRMSDEERERERAAKAAQKAEDDFEESVQRSLEAQNESARVEQIRAEQGEAAAAAEQARLDFLRQHPLAVHQTVEELAKALGLTRQLTDADKERLQNLINAADAAEKGAVAAATDRVQKKQDEEAARAAQRQADEMRRQQENAIRDVADLWEDLFTGGTDRIWKNFKSLGMRIISEIAAQYTLALLSGQSMGSVNIGGIAGGAIANSPLGALFNLGGGLFGRSAANDNSVAGAYGLNFGVSGSDIAKILGGGGNGIVAGDQTVPSGTQMPKAGSLLDQAGFALAASSIVQMTGIGKGGGQMGQLLSLGGSVGGQALGSSIAALGAFGGPVGAIAGAVLGSLVGGVLGKVFKKTKRGEATISGGGISVEGNSGSREEAANGAAQSVMDTMQKLADALGGSLDWSSGTVTISQRKNDWRVDPTGQGASKVKNGAIDFNGDQQAAISYAIRDLIEDGVLTGISDASKRILLAGGDLEKAIEKATLIESVPRLLRERLDPLGAALDAVDDKFRQLASALYEAGASTEQIAQAKELYKLERQDVIDQFGNVAKSLKEFLLSLQAGSNSPLSLRAQKVEAEDALKVYTDQIGAAQAARAKVNQLKARGASAEDIAAAEAAAQAAANKIDQDGFKQTSDLLLSISRNMNASSDQYFEDYDRIRSLTQTAIDLIEQAVPAAGADGNWDALISKTDTTNSLLGSINDNLISLGAKGLTTAQITAANNNNATGSDWMTQNRAYTYYY